jgi:hypothetical protein
MFLLYHSEGCNICEMEFHKCYINELHTTTCSGMLGHRTNKPKFIENGIQMHLLLRFRVEKFYHFFTLEGFTPLHIWYFSS